MPSGVNKLLINFKHDLLPRLSDGVDTLLHRQAFLIS